MEKLFSGSSKELPFGEGAAECYAFSNFESAFGIAILIQGPRIEEVN